MRTTYPVHLILFALSPNMLINEYLRLWSFTLCSSLEPQCVSFVLGLNFIQAPSVRPPSVVHQVAHQYETSERCKILHYMNDSWTHRQAVFTSVQILCEEYLNANLCDCADHIRHTAVVTAQCVRLVLSNGYIRVGAFPVWRRKQSRLPKRRALWKFRLWTKFKTRRLYR